MKAIREKRNDLLEELIQTGANVDYRNKVWNGTVGGISLREAALTVYKTTQTRAAQTTTQTCKIVFTSHSYVGF